MAEDNPNIGADLGKSGRWGKQKMAEKEVKRWFEMKEVDRHEKMYGE